MIVKILRFISWFFPNEYDIIRVNNRTFSIRFSKILDNGYGNWSGIKLRKEVYIKEIDYKYTWLIGSKFYIWDRIKEDLKEMTICN